MEKNIKNRIHLIRQFNRFYTNYLGLLDKHFLQSEFSLSEVRLLYQIAHSKDCTLKTLSEILVMDKGYLSRILKKFESMGLLRKIPSQTDARSQSLELTQAGKDTVSKLEATSDQQIYGQISHLSQSEIEGLAAQMCSIETLLSNASNLSLEEIDIRTDVKPGDVSYIIYLHGKIYGEEYGYSQAFESHMAQTVSGFLLRYPSEKERLWCAEHNGKIIGSIAILDGGEQAKLHWFLIERLYRGLGLGKRLLQSAVEFARECGYSSIRLLTTSDLEQAMRMYRAAGFEKVDEHPNDSWHPGLKEVEFEMKL